MVLKETAIAEICHEANRVYCALFGDLTQGSWDDAPDWQRKSAIDGVNLHLSGDISPEQSHENWRKLKEAEGWKYGEIKDPINKIHPCMVPFSELPASQRQKDYLFKAIVDSFKNKI